MLILPVINIFLIACTATSFSYWVFYHFSPLIWSFNSTLPINEYVPWIREVTRDLVGGHPGIQAYVLYLLMFLNLGLSFALNGVFLSIKRPSLKYLFIVFSLVASFIFFATIKHRVPMAAPAATLPGFMFVGTVFLIMVFLAINHQSWWVPAFVFIFLLILSLATATGLSRIDYNYVLSPAWRFLHGFGLNKTFTQYDYLLSILGAAWMKFFPLETITLLGRISYFALFFGAYLFVRSFLGNKQLACFLLVSMVIVKVYGNAVPLDGIIQVTPWRLDWWLVVLALAYWKTAHHWVVGAGLGLLVVFHHSFGCIYAISYFIFILMLLSMEMVFTADALAGVLKKFFFLYFRNLVIILMAFLFYEIFLRPPFDIVAFYQKTGMNFLRIARQTFFWYMPVIFAGVFLLLCKNRSLLSRRFFETSMLLLSLAIGNSVYFFGRSHDNNIINIAAVLLMVIFVLLDLIHLELRRLSSEKFAGWAVALMAGAFVLIISYQYADRAVKLADTQAYNLKNRSFVANSLSDFKSFDFSQLKTLTHSSPKVIFISQMDFYFYYFGKYSLPQNYQCFTCSWFILKDYVHYLNDHLKDGYYIVVNPQEISANLDIINRLNAHYFSNTSDLFVVSDNPLRGFDKTLWYR